MIFVALMIFTTTACKSMALKDERANLVVAQKGFRATVKTLTALRKAGKISDDEKVEINKIVEITDSNLHLWENALKNGDTLPNLSKIIELNLEKLSHLIIKHKE